MLSWSCPTERNIFIEFPKKNEFLSYYPDYYDEISSPMSLFMINKKLKGGKYTDLESVLKDFLQVRKFR